MQLTKQEITTEVCVVGGGPAGASAALFLNKQGIDCVVVEKAAFPRDKVCGECFDGHAYHTLRKIDPNLLGELKAQGILHESWNYALVQNVDNRLDVCFPKSGTPRLTGRRYRFDEALLNQVRQAPHVQLVTQTEIKHWHRTPDGVTLTDRTGNLTVRARMVIFATGKTPLTAPLNGMTDRDTIPYVFVRGYFKADPAFHAQKSVEIIFMTKPFTYCFYICPVGDDVINVEVGISKKNLEKYGINARDLLLQTIEKEAFIRRRFASTVPLEAIKGAGIGLPRKIPRYSGERYLLAGDSATSVNPLTGFGVGHAMMQGMNAALTAANAIAAGDYSAAFLYQYDRTLRTKLRSEWLLSRVLTAAIPLAPVFYPLVYMGGIRQLLTKSLADTHFAHHFTDLKFYFHKATNWSLAKTS